MVASHKPAAKSKSHAAAQAARHQQALAAAPLGTVKVLRVIATASLNGGSGFYVPLKLQDGRKADVGPATKWLTKHRYVTQKRSSSYLLYRVTTAGEDLLAVAMSGRGN